MLTFRTMIVFIPLHYWLWNIMLNSNQFFVWRNPKLTSFPVEPHPNIFYANTWTLSASRKWKFRCDDNIYVFWFSALNLQCCVDCIYQSKKFRPTSPPFINTTAIPFRKIRKTLDASSDKLFHHIHIYCFYLRILALFPALSAETKQNCKLHHKHNPYCMDNSSYTILRYSFHFTAFYTGYILPRF